MFLWPPGWLVTERSKDGDRQKVCFIWQHLTLHVKHRIYPSKRKKRGGGSSHRPPSSSKPCQTTHLAQSVQKQLPCLPTKCTAHMNPLHAHWRSFGYMLLAAHGDSKNMERTTRFIPSVTNVWGMGDKCYYLICGNWILWLIKILQL